MGSVRAGVLADMLETAGRGSLAAIGGVAEDNRMKQLGDKKAHPLWLVGHLMWGTDFLVNQFLLGVAPVNDVGILMKFAPATIGGPAVSVNVDDYPSWDELVAGYTKAIAACAASIRDLSDDDLAGGLKGAIPDNLPEQAQAFFSGKLDATLSGLILHDAHHRGQIALLGAL